MPVLLGEFFMDYPDEVNKFNDDILLIIENNRGDDNILHGTNNDVFLYVNIERIINNKYSSDIIKNLQKLLKKYSYLIKNVNVFNCDTYNQRRRIQIELDYIIYYKIKEEFYKEFEKYVILYKICK
jgi:hypothetical protein